jgi:hypothetical protein
VEVESEKWTDLFMMMRSPINKSVPFSLSDGGATQSVSTVVGSVINRGNTNSTPEHNAERQNALVPMWSVLSDKV